MAEPANGQKQKRKTTRGSKQVPPSQKARLGPTPSSDKSVYLSSVIRGQKVLPSRYCDHQAAEKANIASEVTELINGIGWEKMLTTEFPTYYELTTEFYATFKVPPATEKGGKNDIQFKLNQREFTVTERELASIFGLKLGGPCKENDVERYKREVAMKEQGTLTDAVGGRNPKATFLNSLALQYVHRVLAHTVNGRSGSTGTVSHQETFLLYCMQHKIEVNGIHWIVRLFKEQHKKRKGNIAGGGFITAIAYSVGLMQADLPFKPVSSSTKVDYGTIQRMSAGRKGKGQQLGIPSKVPEFLKKHLRRARLARKDLQQFRMLVNNKLDQLDAHWLQFEDLMKEYASDGDEEEGNGDDKEGSGGSESEEEEEDVDGDADTNNERVESLSKNGANEGDLHEGSEDDPKGVEIVEAAKLGPESLPEVRNFRPDPLQQGLRNRMSAADSSENIVAVDKKLLILDINGILVDVVSGYVDRKYKHDFELEKKPVFKRPFCDEFLQFCFEKFTVGVWSSRTKRNLDPLVKFLMGDSTQKLFFCFDQSQCTKTELMIPENRDKPLFLKELRKLWQHLDSQFPLTKGKYNETNTLLVDDSPYKALRNPAHTAIFPDSYSYINTGDSLLATGGPIQMYLQRLADAENVQDFVAQNPFGQIPVTESHHFWNFYSKIVNFLDT